MTEVTGSVAMMRLRTTFKRVLRHVSEGDIDGRETQAGWVFDLESIETYLSDKRANGPQPERIAPRGSVKGAFRQRKRDR